MLSEFLTTVTLQVLIVGLKMVVPRGNRNAVHDIPMLRFICKMLFVQSIYFKSLDPMMVIKLPILNRDDMTKREYN